MTTTAPIGPIMCCPLCPSRDAALVAADCPVCRGAGIIRLGAAALSIYEPQVVAQAVTLAVEGGQMTVRQLRDAGVIAPRT